MAIVSNDASRFTGIKTFTQIEWSLVPLAFFISFFLRFPGNQNRRRYLWFEYKEK